MNKKKLHELLNVLFLKRFFWIGLILALFLFVSGIFGYYYFFRDKPVKYQEIKKTEDVKNDPKEASTIDITKTCHDKQTHNSNYFYWEKTGLYFTYPTDWTTFGFKGLEPEFDGCSDQLNIKSKTIAGGNSKDYFLITMQIDNRDGGQLKGGEVKSGNDSFDFYLLPGEYDGKKYVRLYLTEKGLLSTVRLKNGNTLSATVAFSATQGDVAGSSITYDNQLMSTEYAQAIDILRSISYQALGTAQGTTTSEGNGLTRYINEKLGFEFRFPASWSLEQDRLSEDPSKLSVIGNSIKLRKDGSVLSLFRNPGGFGAECSYPAVNFKANFINNKFTLLSRNSSEFEKPDYSCGYMINADATVDNIRYLFFATGDEKNLSEDEKVFTQIANSLTVRR